MTIKGRNHNWRKLRMQRRRKSLKIRPCLRTFTSVILFCQQWAKLCSIHKSHVTVTSTTAFDFPLPNSGAESKPTWTNLKKQQKAADLRRCCFVCLYLGHLPKSQSGYLADEKHGKACEWRFWTRSMLSSLVGYRQEGWLLKWQKYICLYIL